MIYYFNINNNLKDHNYSIRSTSPWNLGPTGSLIGPNAPDFFSYPHIDDLRLPPRCPYGAIGLCPMAEAQFVSC